MLLTGATALPAWAQFDYSAAFSEYASSTYTALGTGSTPITVASPDDENSAAQPIGFSFSFNGQTFTDFVLNTNGFIKLGTTAPSTTTLFYADPVVAAGGLFASTDPADVNLIAPFCANLQQAQGATAAFTYLTTGTAPNRVCTIQWSGLRDKTTPPARQVSNMEFQVKLYETSNAVEFVYGPWTASTAASAFRAAEVGLKGSATDVVVVRKRSAEQFAVAFFEDVPYDETQDASASIRFNYRNAAMPQSGDTYRFTVPVPNDAAVSQLYSLDKLPIPVGTPHVASAVVVNRGTSAIASLPVTLTVSGATTFSNVQTLTNVQPGDTTLVTFASYSPTATGINTLTVSVPADDNSGNNSIAWTQTVNNDTFRYATEDPGTEQISLGQGQEGLWLVKYNTNTPKALLSVGIGFGTNPAIAGGSYYAVLTDDQGTILAQSAPYTALASDLGLYHTFNFPTTPAVPAGDFFVGLAESAATGGNGSMGLQTESIVRPGAYFVAFDLTGTGGLVDIADTGFPLRPMIEATLGAPAACPAPASLAATGLTATGATVTFNTGGGNNFSVVYGPVGFNPATGGTTVTTTTGSANLTGLTSSTSYDVYVIRNCGAAGNSTPAGPVTFTTLCQSSTVTNFPYTENFDADPNQTLPCGITAINDNNDAFTWKKLNQDTLAANTTVGRARSASNFMGYFYNSDDTTIGGDDWFFMPAMQANGQLFVTWWAAATFGGGQIWDEELEVKWGNAPTVAAMTNTIFSGVYSDSAYVQSTSTPINANGTFYIGFHCISQPDELLLRIDDIVVDRLLGVNNPALEQAISIFPNPTTGKVTINLNHAGTQQASLRVLDNLGRVVYSGAAKGNASQQIDLGHLANGLYSLQLSLDGQVVTRRLNVQK